MPFKRLIPVLLLNNEELIHRKKYESSSDKYVGDPINTINVLIRSILYISVIKLFIILLNKI